jgi:hypothetical protein
MFDPKVEVLRGSNIIDSGTDLETGEKKIKNKLKNSCIIEKVLYLCTEY